MKGEDVNRRFGLCIPRGGRALRYGLRIYDSEISSEDNALNIIA